MFRAFLFTLFIILALVIGWHLIFPIMGGVIAITATIWFALLASIVVFCIAVMMLFALTGFGIVAICVFFAVWTGVAVVLFPVIFPILLPLFIIFLFVAIYRKVKRNRNPYSH